MNITSYFSEVLNAPLANPQWSWGSENTTNVFLRTWTPEKVADNKVFVVDLAADDPRLGQAERIRQVESIRAGKRGFIVMLTPLDPDAESYRIGAYDEVVYPIISLEQEEELVFAIIGEGISVAAANGFDAEAELQKLADSPAAAQVQKAVNLRWNLIAVNGDIVVFESPRNRQKMYVNAVTGEYWR
ncbi:MULTISPECIES: hypothetical protein [Microbulbifer]|uniref:hypothetical protein n=1 Tax=Microbulbifer TaxID=48073 RepID=UPI001E52C64A|nr:MULTISPECIES: hypothetical protein [Microbulbifer]UHQ53758.1 hypothetical protein LVE68_09550 [Microbulbifer sp. YPW16]